MSEHVGLRDAVKSVAPELCAEAEKIASHLTSGVRSRLLGSEIDGPTHKVFNDPIWGNVQLQPHEVILNDSKLLQRLAGVKQLGMSYRVYPGAGHGRLEHTRGVLEASARMIDSLDRSRHRQSNRPGSPVQPADRDLVSIRLAALLHDVGHGPFSHVTEPALRSVSLIEFRALERVLIDALPPILKVDTAEMVSILIVLSDAMRPIFAAISELIAGGPELAESIAARIVGSKSYLQAEYLSNVISGPIDADKFDYMPRDCHHSGLPLGIDVNRLLSMLEILKSPAGSEEMGVALAAEGAYEQFVVARVLLYDRLYYHHKVRAAEAMLSELIHLASVEAEMPFKLSHFFLPITDEAFIGLLGGILRLNQRYAPLSKGFPVGGPKARKLAGAILERDLYKRSFAIASRYDKRLESNNEAAISAWTRLRPSLQREAGRRGFAVAVLEKARRLGQVIPDLAKVASEIGSQDILVDLPPNKVVAGKGEILSRSLDGSSRPVNLFFSPDRWATAYEERKHQGYIYSPLKYRELVSFASRLVLFEEYGLHMGREGDRACKMLEKLPVAWTDSAVAAGLCPKPFRSLEIEGRQTGLWILPSAIKIPMALQTASPNFASDFCENLHRMLGDGISPNLWSQFVASLNEALAFLAYSCKVDPFVGQGSVKEKELQQLALRFLEARGTPVTEGAEYAGGETDLVLFGSIVWEMKVFGETENPLRVNANAGYQLRRYTIPTGGNVGFVVMAYKPKSEEGFARISGRIGLVDTCLQTESNGHVRVVVPYGHAVPSGARVS